MSKKRHKVVRVGQCGKFGRIAVEENDHNILYEKNGKRRRGEKDIKEREEN